MALHIVALLIGAVLDLLFGDPHGFVHPVRWMGSFIEWFQGLLERVGLIGAGSRRERAAGFFLVAAALSLFGGGCALIGAAAGAVAWQLQLAFESIVCYYCLAARSLFDESMRVLYALREGGIEDARHAVSMIVGRDTSSLDRAGVCRAAVETVAENACDGVIAPLFYLAFFGPVGGVCYKVANTLDSMVGYRNERFADLGFAAAKLDDAASFLPARITGALMCAAACLPGFDALRAWRVFRRDRLRHASPNSAHGESACAGALGVRLAGDAVYAGVRVEKPFIGDDVRAIEPADIRRANVLMLAASALALALFAAAAQALHMLGCCSF